MIITGSMLSRKIDTYFLFDFFEDSIAVFRDSKEIFLGFDQT